MRFELTFAKPQDNYLRLAMKGGGKKALYPLNCKKMLSGKEGLSVICKKERQLSEAEGLSTVCEARGGCCARHRRNQL